MPSCPTVKDTTEWQYLLDIMGRSYASEVINEARGHRVPKGLPKSPTSHGQYLPGSGLLRVPRKSLLSRSGWCSHCHRGSHWQTVVMVMTGMGSYAGLCTGPQQSLQDKSATPLVRRVLCTRGASILSQRHWEASFCLKGSMGALMSRQLYCFFLCVSPGMLARRS